MKTKKSKWTPENTISVEAAMKQLGLDEAEMKAAVERGAIRLVRVNKQLCAVKTDVTNWAPWK